MSLNCFSKPRFKNYLEIWRQIAQSGLIVSKLWLYTYRDISIIHIVIAINSIPSLQKLYFYLKTIYIYIRAPLFVTIFVVVARDYIQEDQSVEVVSQYIVYSIYLYRYTNNFHTFYNPYFEQYYKRQSLLEPHVLQIIVINMEICET